MRSVSAFLLPSEMYTTVCTRLGGVASFPEDGTAKVPGEPFAAAVARLLQQRR